jgi:hypothetical protein
MAGQADDPDEDDVNKIFSSLKHEFEEQPGLVGADLIRTIVEKRGIRSSARPIFPNLSDSHERMLSTADDTQELLFMAANRHLRAKGEMDFFAVASFAEQVADAEAKDLTETTSRHFRLWLETVVTKYGYLSIETACARFIEAQDHLYTLYNQTAEMQAAVFDYADAWHWLHMELFGEHELAANAEAAEKAAEKAGKTADAAGKAADAAQRLATKTIAGRSEGPRAQARAGALRMAIVENEYKKHIEEETNPNRLVSAKAVAPRILDDVNAAFKLRGLGEFSISTLEKRLRDIINGA